MKPNLTKDLDPEESDEGEKDHQKRSKCLIICVIIIIVLMLPSTLAFLAIF
ncbi:MAG: hypothetical protein ACXAEX_10840 [Promethearchaeota archaeon]|jgi:t-SNARE complex subunit (syntaxin)